MAVRFARLRSILGKFGLAFASILVFLGLAEAGTRLLSPIGPSLVERHEVLGKRYRPNFDAEVYVPEAGRKVRLRFNREGFRGPDLALNRTAGQRRIAVLGDSFVVAVATDEENTAVVQLERLFEESHPEFDWEVQNFAVSSSSTGQQLVLFREVVAAYRPDLVVLAYSLRNDFTDNAHRMSRMPGRIQFEIDSAGVLRQRPITGVGRSSSSWLNRHSRFYVWQKQAKARVRRSWRAKTRGLHPEQRVFQQHGAEELESVWELNARLIETLRGEVEASGASFVVALMPRAEQIDPQRWRVLLELAGDEAPLLDRTYPERRLGRLCKERAIPTVDPAERFRQALEEEGSLFIGGGGHFNDFGNRLVAEALHGFFISGGGRTGLRTALAGERF